MAEKYTNLCIVRLLAVALCLTVMVVWYLSQETLRNAWIVRVSNSQFFRDIVEDIRGIVKGCL